MEAHIMVVDDEKDFLESVNRGLMTSGFNHLTLESRPADALARLQSEERVDVALVDITMPEMSGIELIEEIRKVSPDTQCAVVSAGADVRTAVACMQKGAYDYLVKPVTREALVLCIHRGLRIMEQIRERREAEEVKERLEAQLANAQKMEAIGTLAGGIAHDFNNILGIIIGNTELALEDIPGWNPAHENLEEIRAAAHRAKDVVRQILTFSRQPEKSLTPMNIGPVISEAILLLRSSFPSTITIRPNIEKHLYPVKSEPAQINQVLINLCTNAAHAMGEAGGTLDVNLVNVDLEEEDMKTYPDLAPGRHVRLTVSDTGHGMDPEMLNRIFDPYFSTREVGDGAGMGLAVVQGIVLNHHGTIQVTSSPGKGSSFHVLIPAVTAEPEDHAGERPELPKGTERIFFIDDEPSMVKAYKPLLTRLGYQVTASTDSREALATFSKHPESFDLVITDQTMPEMMGEDLAAAFLHIRPDIPIVLCTGFSERIDKEKALRMGIRAFMMKPVSMHEMARILRDVLDR
jgi:signal transduction histidine kinase